MSEENNFTQLCVWPGVTLSGITPEEFTKSIAEMFGGVRVIFKCELLIEGDEDTEPRSQLLFYIHQEDLSKFALPRLQSGIRWWEDAVFYNDNSADYTKEFLEENPLTW